MKKLNIITAAKYNLKGVDEKFNQAFSTFMEGAENLFQSGLAKYPGKPEEHLSYKEGQKFVKVIREGIQTSVFCFIDKANGNVLKAASWKAPAKGARGNLFDDKNGLGGITPQGGRYNWR